MKFILILIGIIALGISNVSRAEAFQVLHKKFEADFKKCFLKSRHDAESGECFEAATKKYLDYAAAKTSPENSGDNNLEVQRISFIYLKLFKICSEFSEPLKNFTTWSFSETQACQLNIARGYAAIGEASYFESK